MKTKVMLTLLSVLFISPIIHGQVLKGYGIKTGLSFSTQNWFYENPDFEIKNDYKTGLNISMNLEWFSNDHFSLLTDVGYIQKGYKNEIMMTTPDNPENGPLETVYSRFDYLYFSPQLKIRKEFNALIPYAFVGPRIDYQLPYKSDIDLSAIDKDFKEILFGLDYGVGIQYVNRKVGISLEFANFYDFANMMNTQPSQNKAGLRIKNNAYAFVFGFHYYLKERGK